MKAGKKFISILLMVVMMFGISFDVQASTSLKASEIASYFNGRVGNSYPSGMCLAFVADCFRNLGATRSSTCCAYNYGNSHIVSTDSQNIPIGADVFFGNCGGGPCGSCGASYYGHIGVYVGDGYFVHATGGKVQKSTLSSLSSQYRGWGYHGNVSVVDDLSVAPPGTPQISKNQYWYDLTDTIEITAYADGATSYYMSMFKDGERIKGESVPGGKFTMSASDYGIGDYSVYFSCTNGVGTVDTEWLTFSVVGAAGYSDVWVRKPIYNLNETVSISVSTICAKGQVIGIDKVGEGRVITEQCESTYTISASQLGVGTYSAYFSVWNGSGSIDTERVEFVITEGSKVNPFEDVYENDFYYNPVLWAVGKGITDGWTPTQFAPSMGCTRGQVVTFLWRAAGKPKASNAENPFKDVAENAYYYDAVLWAVEKGITDGWLPDEFAPEMTCTRGQIVTFIWRAADKPEAGTDTCAFTDVAENAYYRDAVLWAVEEGITDGWLPTQFAPEMECTRGQIVTFLYRYYN